MRLRLRVRAKFFLFFGSGALKILVCCVCRGFYNPLVRGVLSVAVALKIAVIRLSVVLCWLRSH